MPVFACVRLLPHLHYSNNFN